MVGWNYRVVKKTYPNGETLYGVHEVYYASDIKTPTSCTEEPISFQEESLGQLISVVAMVTEALNKDVLNYDDIGMDSFLWNKGKNIEWLEEE